MQLVNQLKEELGLALEKRDVLERELDSMNFCISVLSKELDERI